VSGALNRAARGAYVRNLLRWRTIDAETVMGAIAAYLMTGMFFAFLYRAVGIVQTHPPFFGPQGPGTFSQDLFFSFTTLTTTGYGDLTPAGNPGQSFAVLEMLIGQLFLITAVGKVVSSWRPGQGHGGLREKHDGESHRPSSPEPPAARPTLFRGIPRDSAGRDPRAGGPARPRLPIGRR
jgi:hypothetical protein